MYNKQMNCLRMKNLFFFYSYYYLTIRSTTEVIRGEWTSHSAVTCVTSLTASLSIAIPYFFFLLNIHPIKKELSIYDRIILQLSLVQFVFIKMVLQSDTKGIATFRPHFFCKWQIVVYINGGQLTLVEFSISD